MTLSPNIVLGNDYVTAYFADQIWPKTLKDHRKRWDEIAKSGDPTPRSRLGELSKEYFRLKPDAAAGEPAALAELCARVTSALGYPVYWRDSHEPNPASVAMRRGDDHVDVSGISVVPEDDEPPQLIVIQATEFTTDPSFLITNDAMPTRQPNQYGDLAKIVDGAETIPRFINYVYALEDAPRWIIVVGGGAVALIDHKPWLDGKWLGANLDDILSNNDRAAGGELDQLAGWFSTAGTIADDEGNSLLDTAVDGSRRQAVGVSESLRDAVRDGVEAIANEVLYDRRERRKLSVFGEQGGVTVDAADLARQSIRWMYRLVVLLYAEARPTIGILPTTAAGTALYDLYENGYGLERLRQLSLVELDTEAARNGTHIHQSLNLLFRLVNEGHHRPTDVELTAEGDDTWTGIEFTPLNSRLFGKTSCPDIDNSQLRDHVLQKVVKNLTTVPGDKGKGLQQVSYANLEINQLGAVYEGLMAYTGFIALEDRYEVAARKKGDRKTKDGVSRSADPSRGSWTIPVTDYDRYPEDVFVTEKDDDTGEIRLIVHEKGSFVFRLAGRDRARSASFYTPSVLTEFTVRHTLEEWRANHPDLTAADVLKMTILEPALGSGAFANEACDQAAELYLRLREAEVGETVPAEDRAIELRKLRAHFAINQTYGVDLNDTSVELAEVSLWLNSMHPGLAAPPLSHRLRRGNSLIGCTRSTYTEDQVARKPWKGDVFPPTDKPLHRFPLGSQGIGIHHFLLPGEGWGAAAKTGKSNPCRELAPEWCEEVWAWRGKVQSKPTKAQITRAKLLADKVEALWAVAASEVEQHVNAQNRPISIWNGPGVDLARGRSDGFKRPDGAYQRLRAVLDAWCAFWMWAPESGADLPTIDQWHDCINYLTGDKRADADGRLFGEHTTLKPPSPDADGALFETDVTFDDSTSVADARGRWPWLATAAEIASKQAFFHWELDFAPVSEMGGFDLQVGNPPWVRPTWDEPLALAEHDPWWGVTKLGKVAAGIKTERRSLVLESERARDQVAAEAAEGIAVNALLSAVSREPRLDGLGTNLYMNFMTGTFRRVSSAGAVGLLHPESHFGDPKGGPLRREVYARLRRHWQFANELLLFSDVHNQTEFGVNVYCGARQGGVRFLQAAFLLQPATLDLSATADESAELPGTKYADGGWDTRPHPARIVVVDDAVLEDWVRLFDSPGTLHTEARLFRPLTQRDLAVLTRFAGQERRLRDASHHWIRGFDEKEQKDDGTLRAEISQPIDLTQLVLQGPHILNAQPFAQSPRGGSNKDWDDVGLEGLNADFIPRTQYVMQRPIKDCTTRVNRWDGTIYTDHVREAHREFVPATGVRTLQSCVVPPGPPQLLAVNSVVCESDYETVRWSGLLSSLPVDYLAKSFGISHTTESVTKALPFPPTSGVLDDLIVERTLRLNCVTNHHAHLWDSLMPELDNAEGSWSAASPLRDDEQRWRALCELDSLAALILSHDEDSLIQMYRSQFGILRMYEHSAAFDSGGHRVAKYHHDWAPKQRSFEDELKAKSAKRGQNKLKLWERIEAIRDGDANVDLAYLVSPFRRADRELAMRTAYRAFAERSGKTEGMSTEPLPEWELWG